MFQLLPQILSSQRAQLQCDERRNGYWRNTADCSFSVRFFHWLSLQEIIKDHGLTATTQAGLEFLPCLLSHSQVLSLCSKIVLEFDKNSIKFIMENDGEETHVLPDFLNASTTSVKSSVNCSYAQLLFSKDHFIFWSCWYLIKLSN